MSKIDIFNVFAMMFAIFYFTIRICKACDRIKEMHNKVMGGK